MAPRQLQPGLRWKAYDDSRPIAWIRGTHLTSGEDVLVPHVRVDLDWSRAHPNSGLFLVTSTGLGSGNEREEALCHAILMPCGINRPYFASVCAAAVGRISAPAFFIHARRLQ